MPQGKIKDENTRVMVVLSKDVKERAAKIATADGRSLSGWIRNLVTNEVSKFDNDTINSVVYIFSKTLADLLAPESYTLFIIAFDFHLPCSLTNVGSFDSL